MSRVPRLGLLALLAAGVLLAPGCLVRKLKIIRPGISSGAKLQTATLEQLLEKLQAWDQQIRTVNLTVDLEPSLGSAAKGEVSELKDVRAFILIRKPQTIRLIGLYPVVRNRAFDMVSDGVSFKAYVVAKNKFIVGKNLLDQRSPHKLENLRPQHIFEALVVAPATDSERPILENDTDEVEANYVLHMVHEKDGRLLLSRNVWFDRVHLRVTRQQVFDPDGEIVSDARYADYDNVRGVAFPKQFAVMRPKDEYGVRLSVKKVELNAPLGDEKFALERPPGSDLVDLSVPKPAQGVNSHGNTAPPRRPGGAGGQ